MEERSTFEADFVKLDLHFNINLKYTSIVLKEVYIKYALALLQNYTLIVLEKLYGPFLWIRLNCLKTADSLQNSLLLTTKFLEAHETNLNNLKPTTDWVNFEAT